MMKIFLRLLVFVGLYTLVSADNLSEILQKDSFFTFRTVNLGEMSLTKKSFDYSLHRGFYSAIAELDRSSLRQRQMSADWIRSNTPLGLVEYAAAHSFQLEFHFGSTHESLFFLKKEGFSELYHVRSARRIGFEFLVIPEREKQLGRLIVTNINSESELYLLQAYFYCYGLDNNLPFSTELVRIYDFHLTGRESYQSAHMKEYLFAVPFGTKSVITGIGEELFSIILRRRFAAMSLQFLRDLYGANFLSGLQAGIVDIGQTKAQDWEIGRFLSLQEIQENLLSAGEYELFLQFEAELAALLKPSDSPLAKLILIGNELSVHKEPLRKSELMRRLQLVSPRDGSQLSVFALPIDTASGRERVLFVSGVKGDGVSSLLNVLHNVGLNSFYYFGTGLSTQNKSGIFLPQAYKFVDERRVVLGSTNIFSQLANKFNLQSNAEGFHSFSPLLGTPENLQLLGRKGINFLDDSGYYFVQAINALPIHEFGMALAAQAPTDLDNLSGIMQVKGLEQGLADLLIAQLGIKDIPVFATEADFGFTALEEKLLHHLARFHIPAEQAILYLLRLELHIIENISTAEEMDKYLKDRDLGVSGNSYGVDTFLQFVDRPYRDSDVSLRLMQYAKALEDLKRYLVLLGEPEPVFCLYGDFVMGRVTPLSPLLLSIDNISQHSLIKLFNSPFAGQTGGRPTLIKIIAAENRIDKSTNKDLLSYQEENLFQDYFQALAQRGISFHRQERIFSRVSGIYSPEYERILSRVHRWQQGCEVFKLMAGTDFLSRKCQIFNYSTIPSKPDNNPDTMMMTGINKLKIEGLELMKAITDITAAHPAFPNAEKERIISFIATFISALDNFALAFGID